MSCCIYDRELFEREVVNRIVARTEVRVNCTAAHLYLATSRVPHGYRKHVPLGRVPVPRVAFRVPHQWGRLPQGCLKNRSFNQNEQPTWNQQSLKKHWNPFLFVFFLFWEITEFSLPYRIQPTTAQRCRTGTEKNILEDLFSSLLSQLKKSHLPGNLKLNYIGNFSKLVIAYFNGKKSFHS